MSNQSLELDQREHAPTPAFPGSASMTMDHLAQIECTGVYERAVLDMTMVLTDATRYDVTGDAQTAYGAVLTLTPPSTNFGDVPVQSSTGGTITLTAREPRGTCVTIVLPVSGPANAGTV